MKREIIFLEEAPLLEKKLLVERKTAYIIYLEKRIVDLWEPENFGHLLFPQFS